MKYQICAAYSTNYAKKKLWKIWEKLDNAEAHTFRLIT